MYLEECAAENAGVGASQRVRSPDGEAKTMAEELWCKSEVA